METIGEKAIRCNQCGALLPEEARFCAYCGARVTRPLAVPFAYPQPTLKTVEPLVYPSDLVYLFSDRFVPGKSLIDWLTAERGEQTPCKDRFVKRRELARALLLAAFTYLASEGVITLSPGKREALGGVLTRDTVHVLKRRGVHIDPTSLECLLMAELDDKGGLNALDLVRAVIKRNSRFTDRVSSHNTVTRIVKRHLVQRGLLMEVDAGGITSVRGRKKTVGVCERIPTLESDALSVQEMLARFRESHRELYSRLLYDISDGIYAESLIP